MRKIMTMTKDRWTVENIFRHCTISVLGKHIIIKTKFRILQYFAQIVFPLLQKEHVILSGIVCSNYICLIQCCCC